MAKGLGTLTVWLTADTKGLSSGFARAQSMIMSWKGALAAAVGGFSFAAFATSAVEAFMEAEDAAAQLQRVLESTNFAAGFNAVQINEFAADLQKTTRFEDDAIAKGMALLATFTNIKGDNFKAATTAALDLSTVMGTDLQASITQIGKALNDPIKGITALSRVGVSFSEEQKAKIKELVGVGKLQEAQLVILAELSKEFGGQASAAANTTAGRLAQLNNAWGDIKETIGELVVNVLDLNGLFGDGTGTLQTWGDVFKANVMPIAFQIKSVFIELKFAVLQTGTAIANLASPIMSIFETAYTNISNIISWIWDNASKLVKTIPEMIIAAIKDVFQFFSGKDFISSLISGKGWDEAINEQLANMGRNIDQVLTKAGVTRLEIAEPDLSGWSQIIDDIGKLDEERQKAQDGIFQAALNRVGAKPLAMRPGQSAQSAAEAATGGVKQESSVVKAIQRGTMEALKAENTRSVDTSKKIAKHTERTAKATEKLVKLMEDQDHATLELQEALP